MASSRSRAFPCGTPSIMSISTTSASSLEAIQCAAVAPTLPAPTIETFLRICRAPVRFGQSKSEHQDHAARSCASVNLESMQKAGWQEDRPNVCSVSSAPRVRVFLSQGHFASRGHERVHVADHVCCEFTRLNFGSAFHLTLEVVGHLLLTDGGFECIFDKPGCFAPANQLKHHDAR